LVNWIAWNPKSQVRPNLEIHSGSED